MTKEEEAKNKVIASLKSIDKYNKKDMQEMINNATGEREKVLFEFMQEYYDKPDKSKTTIKEQELLKKIYMNTVNINALVLAFKALETRGKGYS